MITNSHQGHSGGFVVTLRVERLGQEVEFAGSEAQLPSLSFEIHRSEVLFEFFQLVVIDNVENRGALEDKVFCGNIANEKCQRQRLFYFGSCGFSFL